MKKPLFVFRFEPANRFSLAALFGSLSVRGLLGEVELVVAGSRHAAVKALGARQGFLCHSFCSTDALSSAAELNDARKSLGDSFTAVAGGAHASGDPEGTLRLGYDVVFCGRAERSFPDFVKAVIAGAPVRRGEIVGEAPDENWPETLYISDVKGFFPVLELQRGCAHRCAFCQAGRMGAREGVRFKSLDTVRRFLRMHRSRGMTRVYFLTPSAFDYAPPGAAGPLDGVEALLSMCRGEGMRFVEYGIFPCEVRPAFGTGPFFDLLRKYASNRRVVVGAQSFSERMLRSLGRGHGAGEIVSTITEASQRKIRPYVDVVFGMPGEDQDDRKTTLEAMESLFHSHGARMQLHHYIPLPGTPWYHRDPQPLDTATVRRIERMERAGMTRGWWREGQGMAAAIKSIRDGNPGK